MSFAGLPQDYSVIVEDPDPTNTRPGTWRKFFERCVRTAPGQDENSGERVLFRSFETRNMLY